MSESEDEEILVEISVFSEKTGDSIGCGIYCDTESLIQRQVADNTRSIMDSLGESFWELIGEFEWSLSEAYEKLYPGEEYNGDKLAPVDVFGNFIVEFTANGQRLNNVDLGFDINDFMYDGYICYCDPNL